MGDEITKATTTKNKSSAENQKQIALQGLKVIDAATLFAGPMIATLLGDFGADVIKVEHPRGDAQRTLGWEKDGIGLWWLVANRNKRCVTLDLHKGPAREVFKHLVADTDILIENFRPGTLESWELGYEVLHAVNPRLIMIRVTGFGQNGPYSKRPGFGTLAEAMSGLAHINGDPDGPPMLPPFALGDGVAALCGTAAAMIALYNRDVVKAKRGEGQYIDLSIIEPLFSILGPQATVYDQLGVIQGRTGNRAPFTSPRNAYKTADNRWFVVSGSAQSIAERILLAVDRPDLVAKEWFSSHTGRLKHEDELDAAIGKWISEHSSEEVAKRFEEFQAAGAFVYSIEDILADAQFRFREMITTVLHDKLGPVRLPNVVPKLSDTPGQIRYLGRDLGADNEEIFIGRLGYSREELEGWRREGII